MTQKEPITRQRIVWWRKILYALLPALMLFPLLECTLIAFGVRPITDRHDPYVGFVAQIPLFEEVLIDQIPMMTTAPAKLVWFNSQTFPQRKPAGTKRIFCLGGSTTFGRPYADLTSFSGWMRELLPVADSTCSWEVINAGGVSYASYRVAAVMEELSQYDPDIFVIFSAHNEFLERRTYANMFSRPDALLRLQALASRTRTFAVMDRLLVGNRQPAAATDILPAEVDERLNHTIGPQDYTRDPVWQRKVVEHYRVNLQRMVDIAERAGAQIVLVAPASNEKDCSPFKSELDSQLNPDQRSDFQSLLQQILAAEQTHDWPRTVELCAQALSIDSGYAEVHYRLGRALFGLQDFERADFAFGRAVQEDVCPLRAIEAITAAIHEISESHSIPLVDFQSLLREKCQVELGHRCLGKEYFLDHVHPDIDTHRDLAIWLIDALQQAGLASGQSLQDADYAVQVQGVIRTVEGRIDVSAHGVALRNLAKVLHWSGKFEEAAPRASDALELLPRDPESRFVLADCLKNIGDPQAALAQYEILQEDTPEFARAYLPFGELLVESELYERAKPQLLFVLLREPQNAYAYYLLGRTHLALSEYAFALECFEQADKLYPNESLTMKYLSQARQLAAGL